MLGFPAVTLRSSIERLEALDTGAITMTDPDPATVMRGVRFAMARGGGSGGEQPADHQVTNTSERVVNLILSTALPHEFWSALRQGGSWRYPQLPGGAFAKPTNAPSLER